MVIRVNRKEPQLRDHPTPAGWKVSTKTVGNGLLREVQAEEEGLRTTRETLRALFGGLEFQRLPLSSRTAAARQSAAKATETSRVAKASALPSAFAVARSSAPDPDHGR